MSYIVSNNDCAGIKVNSFEIANSKCKLHLNLTFHDHISDIFQKVVCKIRALDKLIQHMSNIIHYYYKECILMNAFL